MNPSELRSVLNICRKHALPRNGKRVLAWHQGGYFALQKVDTLLSFMLELHGYTPLMVVCDGVLQACTVRGDEDLPPHRWKERCPLCIRKSLQLLELFGIPHVFLSSLLQNVDFGRVEQMVQSDNPFPKNFLRDADLDIALSDSLVRFYKGLGTDFFEESIIKKFTFSTYCNYFAAKNALKLYKPDRAVIVHCAYSDHHPPYDVFTNHNVPVVTSSSTYLPESLVVNTIGGDERRGKRGMTDRQWNEIAAKPLCEDEKRLFTTLWEDRYKKRQHVDSVSQPVVSRDELAQALFLDSSKKTFLFPLHIDWDVSSEMSLGVFKSYEDLVLTTVQEMCAAANAQWLIKVHPCEEIYNTVNSAGNIIRRKFPNLPNHVRLIPGDAPFSPFAFFNFCDGLVGTQATSIVEMAALGKICLMASKGFYYHRGFTLDPDTVDEYVKLLHQLPELPPPGEAQITAAKHFLIAYFYRMSIRLPNYRHSDMDFCSSSGFTDYIPGKNSIVKLLVDSIENCEAAMRPLSEC